MSNASIALKHASRGWKVFPLVADTKFPRLESPGGGKGGFHQAVTDKTQIREWWTTWPNDLVGLSCIGSGLVVIDIDVSGGKDGEERWAEFLAAAGVDEPETYEVRTGSGGRHLYFSWSGGVDLTGKLCGVSSIDVKYKGHVVAGGQGRYEVVRDVEPIELPTWLLKAVGKHRRDAYVRAEGSVETGPSFHAHVGRIVAAIKYADEGEGNTVAAAEAPKLGNYVAAGQLDEEEALRLLESAVDEWSWRDDKSRRGMYRTLARQLAFGMLTPRAWTESADDALSRIKRDVQQMTSESGKRKYVFAELVKVVDLIGFMNQGEWERALRSELGQTSAEFRKFINEARKRRRLETEEVLDFDANANHAALATWVIENKLEAGRYISWRGDMYRWIGPRWEVWEDFESWVQTTMAGLRYVGGDQIKELNTTDPRVNSLCRAILKTSTIRRSSELEEDRSKVSLRNGLYDVKTGEFSDHSPSLFNLWSLDFDYDPGATCPTFDSLRARYFPADHLAWDFLLEWLGYLVSGDTDLQTLAAFWGAAGSGKGTLTRVIMQLIGKGNVASSELSTLADGGNHWAEGFYDKPLLIINEADNWGQLTQKGISRIKMISGGDGITVDPKHKKVMGNVVVPSRVMLVSNERPEFKDPDGALDRRTIFLHFTEGIKDRDPGIEARLAGELSGIFRLAVQSYRAMRYQDGRVTFTKPLGSDETKADIREITQSERVFAETCLVRDDNGLVFVEDMLLAYIEMTGNSRANANSFGRRVAAPIKDINRSAVKVRVRPNDEFRRANGKLSQAWAWQGVMWSESGLEYLSEAALSEHGGR